MNDPYGIKNLGIQFVGNEAFLPYSMLDTRSLNPELRFQNFQSWDPPETYDPSAITSQSFDDWWTGKNQGHGASVTGPITIPTGLGEGHDPLYNFNIQPEGTRLGYNNGLPGLFFNPENSSLANAAQRDTEGGWHEIAKNVVVPAALAVGGAALGGAFGADPTAAQTAAAQGAIDTSAAGSQIGLAGSNPLMGSNMGYFDDLLNLSDTSGGLGDYNVDPNTGDVTGGVLGNYNIDPNTGDVSSGTASPGVLDKLRQLGGSLGGSVLQLLKGDGSIPTGKSPSLGQSVLGQVGSDPLSAAFSATPFLLALNEANKQGGDINDTIGKLRELENSVSGNTSPYMNAVLNPYDQATGTGRAALLQDQSLRGIRGSSFGDQSLNSYDYTRDLGRGDIASKALLGATGLQGNLLGSELGAINARNTNRNLLLGAGLSASGRLFQPQQDPFNLNTLLGLK